MGLIMAKYCTVEDHRRLYQHGIKTCPRCGEHPKTFISYRNHTPEEAKAYSQFIDSYFKEVEINARTCNFIDGTDEQQHQLSIDISDTLQRYLM